MRGDAYARAYGQPSRVRHLFVLGAAAFAAVALGTLVILVGSMAISGEDDDSSTTSTDTPGGASGSGGAGNSGFSGGKSGQGVGEWESDPVTGLPIGATSRDGHPVGFPRTEAGAAAMVVELNRAQIGLDYDTALTTIRVYAAPQDQAFFDELAISAVAQRRKDLGVPAQDATQDAVRGGGQVNAPVGYAQTPTGYQVQEYGPDFYLVSVLNELTATTSRGRVTRSAYVGQQFVRWSLESPGSLGRDGSGLGDWQLVEPSATEREQLSATALPAGAVLGSPEFEQAGWTPLFDPAMPSAIPGAIHSAGIDTATEIDGVAAGPLADDGSP